MSQRDEEAEDARTEVETYKYTILRTLLRRMPDGFAIGYEKKPHAQRDGGTSVAWYGEMIWWYMGIEEWESKLLQYSTYQP